MTSGGSGNVQFPVGDVFLMETDPALPTRAVPSWFFGDGARLINEVAAQFQNVGDGLQFARIVPLDEMLGSDAAKAAAGNNFGIRFGRRIVSGLGFELSVDWNRPSLDFSDAAREAIDRTRASFVDTFSDLLDVAPVTNVTVGTQATYGSGSLRQLAITGAFTITVGRIGAVDPYLLIGGGIVRETGSLPELTLRGTYQFNHLGVSQISESDVVRIRFHGRESAPLAALGFGFVVNFGRHNGLRFDVRAQATQGGVSTTVSTNPSRSGLAQAVLPSNTNPGVQFSSANGIRSSLSVVFPETETRSAGTLQARALVSVGYVVRF